MTRRYNFTLETTMRGSVVSQILELQFDDDSTEEEITDQVNEVYEDWVSNNNNGGWSEIK